MKKLFIFVFALSGTLGFSQRVGFMGKHFSLNAAFLVYPALYHPVANDQAANGYFTSPQWFGFNYKLNVNVDAIVSKKSTVGLDFNYYHTATSIDTSLFNPGLYSVTREFDAFAVGAHYRVFFGNTKAPVGFYYKVETGGTIYSMNGYTTGGNWYVNNYIGRQHVFFGRLLVDYGFSFGLVMPTLYGYYSSGSGTFENRLNQAGNLRSLWHSGINVYGGIGVLLF
jgi:hypothetical protein